MDVTYRLLDRRDIPRACHLAEQLAAELPTQWQTPYARDGQHARIMARTSWIVDTGAIIGAESGDVLVGLIALVVYEHPVLGVLTAGEACWYVNPMFRTQAVGRALLESAETWALSRGCVMLQIAAPAGSRAGVLYRRRGYVEVETAFAKRLG